MKWRLCFYADDTQLYHHHPWNVTSTSECLSENLKEPLCQLALRLPRNRTFRFILCDVICVMSIILIGQKSRIRLWTFQHRREKARTISWTSEAFEICQIVRRANSPLVCEDLLSVSLPSKTGLFGLKNPTVDFLLKMFLQLVWSQSHF